MGSSRIGVKSYIVDGHVWDFWKHWQLNGNFGFLVFIHSFLVVAFTKQENWV
jgi:hypothetical protein